MRQDVREYFEKLEMNQPKKLNLGQNVDGLTLLRGATGTEMVPRSLYAILKFEADELDNKEQFEDAKKLAESMGVSLEQFDKAVWVTPNPWRAISYSGILPEELTPDSISYMGFPKNWYVMADDDDEGYLVARLRKKKKPTQKHVGEKRSRDARASLPTRLQWI
jgi:hypothetical protein